MRGEYIKGDCMEYLKGYKDNHFDLAVVDVPYGINESGQTNKTRSKLAKSKDYGSKNWDKTSPSKEYFNELIRVSKDQIIWGANHFISKIPFNSSCWIVWDKNNGKTDFADSELAYTSFRTAVRNFRYRWQGMLQQDMKNKEIRVHPTQKPVALYRWLLQNYAKPNDLILDTHVGSASSLIACEMEGFNYVGFEKDSDYYEASTKRIKQHLAQQVLF